MRKRASIKLRPFRCGAYAHLSIDYVHYIWSQR
nr:MAG TPA: hypothetical protein [Caudoviricetes sp.]